MPNGNITEIMGEMSMKIAFVYDDQDDYFVTDRIEYADFCLKEEANLITCALEKLGHTVKVIKGKSALRKKIYKMAEMDLVFNKTEGFKSRNREGLVPETMEMFEIPFVGTDAYGFSLSLNKYHTKLIAKDKGILTPNCVLVENKFDYQNINNLKFPIIIKPNNEGSSMGCNVFYKLNNEVYEAIKELLNKFKQPVIVEEYIDGIDISVPVIGTGDNARCMGIVEFRNNDGSYPEIASTEFKYIDDHKANILIRCDKVLNQINKSALSIYTALGCKDYGRVDFRLSNDKPFFLEINPLPTLCKNGAFDICASNLGMSMVDIIEKIINSAISMN